MILLMAGISYSGIELRKLPHSIKVRIGQSYTWLFVISTDLIVLLVDIQESWRVLMASIPSERDPELPKYTTEHMMLIERHGKFSGKSCGEILIDEWSTSGKVRPTADILFKLLTKCQLYRAADFVATEVLNVDAPVRPTAGPAARIPTLTEEIGNIPTASTILETDEMNSNVRELLELLNNQDPESGNLINFNAAAIETATRNFDEAFKIGSGAFGEVYKLDLATNGGLALAVKALHPSSSMVEDQFLTEIRALSRHENLVPLIGFCSSAPRFCLVYEFMSKGSLLKAIACEEDNVSPIKWNYRKSITFGIAKGIRFLHCGKEKPLIHRDIKSANVLLDNQLVPKLGDFGLAKSLSSQNMTSAQTSTIIGTSAYMAPEAFRGDISPKMDVFSFGVIILELLTGLAPYDEEREGNDIITFIEDTVEDDDILPLIDCKAGTVDNDEVNSLYQLSQKCLEDKKRRLTSDRVVQELECILAR
ncbi:Interleukin-1 receptor-associated kinase 4 [Orchesella cincta]|uniref:non-specific serine/threonine protein kinase n=1 Tax=Orchesella cincta TaxID=48709 RepID=A0A1D2MIH0_ORCCI|nr:Interleukin-1 receptor-associated kinase 4 [Orchesella cincta]